ncbi:MAG: hypothetical protein EBV58_02720 [Actinobacteria bacterium]|nr:hypothetical protein [Actinomycetota bacterium]
MTANGFEFIDFVAFGRWERSRPDGLRTFLGELIHADALFMRSPESALALAKTRDDTDLVLRYRALLCVYARSDMMRTTLAIASEQNLLNEQLLKKIWFTADQIDSRLHRFQSRFNVLSSITGWTDTKLRFNVVT